jgi:hypothetical protein
MTELLRSTLLGYDGQDREIRDLIERASALSALQQTDGWAHYRDYLLSLSLPVQKRLILGSYKTIEEYREAAGWLRGITDATEALTKIQDLIETLIRQANEQQLAETPQTEENYEPV